MGVSERRESQGSAEGAQDKGKGAGAAGPDEEQSEGLGRSREDEKVVTGGDTACVFCPCLR